MADNTLLKYFFSSGSEVDPEGQFNLTRKTRTQRLREIYTIMQKHHFTKGFTPESFRSMLEGLGPSFVKIGQTLSTRSEILPKAYCDELKKLQARSKPLPFDEMLAAMDAIYGDEREKLFAEIDPMPLGSASLAQVHKARLADGSVVAVKIQRPGVRATMAQDIDIMRIVARQASRFIKDGQMLDLRDVVEELWATFLEETDFKREAANLQEFALAEQGCGLHRMSEGVSGAVPRRASWSWSTSTAFPSTTSRSCCDAGYDLARDRREDLGQLRHAGARFRLFPCRPASGQHVGARWEDRLHRPWHDGPPYPRATARVSAPSSAPLGM